MFAIIFFVSLLFKLEVYGYGIVATSAIVPYQASLRYYYNNDHHCSGTIIGSQFILTAAHCVCHNVYYYMLYVVVGANSFTEDGPDYEIADAICHEDFDFNYLKNDIALLKLADELEFCRHVQAIPLINFELPRKPIFLISVWKYKRNYVVPPSKFKVLPASLFNIRYCASLFPQDMLNYTTNFCTITNGQGAYIGDSGGPVVFAGYLVGLISFGKKEMTGFPNVHTNVSAFADWINEQIFFETNSLEDDY